MQGWNYASYSECLQLTVYFHKDIRIWRHMTIVLTQSSISISPFFPPYQLLLRFCYRLSAVAIQNQPSSLYTSIYAVGRGCSCVVSILRVAYHDMTLLRCKYPSITEVFLHAERPK